VLEGELTVKRNGQTGILHQGETAVIEPGVWHDWWNASNRDARVRVEITPGERFVHMIETFFASRGSDTLTARACPSFKRSVGDVEDNGLGVGDLAKYLVLASYSIRF
jgi:hypothetical protein